MPRALVLPKATTVRALPAEAAGKRDFQEPMRERQEPRQVSTVSAHRRRVSSSSSYAAGGLMQGRVEWP
jgi:hypothetical protein